MTEETQKEYLKLKSILTTYMTEENIKQIDKYFELALKIYDGMTRMSGSSYISHPINVAIILAELRMNTLTIGCALIHEGIKLERITEEEIEATFGEESAIIVNSITKLSSLKSTLYKNDIEKYRRIVVGLSEHPISLFIKLADRLDNLRSVELHEKDHIENIIDETEKIFIPIAHRLGIKTMKSELEDLCLKNANPELYQNVLNKISADKEELEKSLFKMRDELINLLNKNNIKFEILYRVKSVRGIYNKLKTGRKWEEIFDLLGLRLILNKVEDCYLAVGLIHAKYRPIPKRFKDYIANPKNNMYQSLHTTIFGEDGRIFEIQIRTHEMDEIAEHGVASHWSYKEKTDGSKVTDLENKLAAFRTLIEVNDMENNIDFFKNFNKNLVKEEIYVFTPKGDVIELPKDSTPIDFAYKIHSEVGNTTKSALVNGKQVKLDYILQDGDIVDLKIEKGKTPNKGWLKFVKTEVARNRIKSFFNKKEKKKTLDTGKELISEEIKKHKLNEKELMSEEILNKLLEKLYLDSIDDLYIAVSTFKYTPNFIVNKLKEISKPKEETIESILNSFKTTKNKNTNNLIINGQTDILTSLAPCCNPVLGDEIIGFITKGEGVMVHRKNCKNVNLSSERIIDVEWNEDLTTSYETLLTIYLDSSNENLIKIINIATKLDINILSINNKKSEVYELKCKVKNKEKLNNFINELENTNFINKVER